MIHTLGSKQEKQITTISFLNLERSCSWMPSVRHLGTQTFRHSPFCENQIMTPCKDPISPFSTEVQFEKYCLKVTSVDGWRQDYQIFPLSEQLTKQSSAPTSVKKMLQHPSALSLFITSFQHSLNPVEIVLFPVSSADFPECLRFLFIATTSWYFRSLMRP